jgi:hypothetical protein
MQGSLAIRFFLTSASGVGQDGVACKGHGGRERGHTSIEMLLYSLLALSKLCCITALDSTVEPSGSSAI